MKLPRSILVIGALALFAFLIWVFPEGCTQPDEARRVLAAQGYTDILITGYRPFMGGRDDTYSTGFQAKTPAGAATRRTRTVVVKAVAPSLPTGKNTDSSAAPPLVLPTKTSRCAVTA